MNLSRRGLLHSLGFALLAIGIGSDFTAQAASVRGSAATTADADALTDIDVEHTDKALNTEDDNQRRLARPTSAGGGKKPKDQPTPPPSTSPTKSPVPEATYCGCPECTATVWNTPAYVSSGDQATCGARILWKQTSEGGSLSEAAACSFVSNEFSNGPCGPVCNPEICNGTPSPTKSPSLAPTPTTANPTKSPTTGPTPAVITPTFCGCPACTESVWNNDACDGGECYTCGNRINWLQTPDGGSKSEQEACAQVSFEFPDNVCGPHCNPQLCNPDYLDEPNEANLIWSDEFETDGAPNSSNWDYDIGDGCNIGPGMCGWGNSELQTYTSNSENVNINNGILRITAKSNGGSYTSARLVSRGKKTFKYGRIRFRATVANCQGLGTWPALWLLPESSVYGTWPNSGEIDVMETVGYEADKFFGTVHTGAYNHQDGTERGGSVVKSKLDWYIFEIDWQADNIRFAIDGQVFYQFVPDNVEISSNWPFNQDFHILMNIAVGGSWGGAQGIDSTAFSGDGQYMEIDWVRAYSN